MKNLVDLFNTNQELYDKFISSNITILSNVMGIDLHVYNDNGKVKYALSSNSNNSESNYIEITDFEKLFVKNISKSLKELNNKEDLLKQYKYLQLKISDSKIYLISAISLTDEIVKNNENLSKELNFELLPVIFKGKLDTDQQDKLSSLIMENSMIDLSEFNNFINNLFNVKLNNISGILLQSEINNKFIQYFVNCYIKYDEDIYKNDHIIKDKIKSFFNDEIKENIDECNEYFLSKMHDPALHNKLMNICANYKEKIFIEMLEINNKELVSKLQRFGNNYKVIYKTFLENNLKK